MKKVLFFLILAVMLLSGRGFAQSSCTTPTGLTASLHSPDWYNVILNWNAVTDSTQADIMWSTTTMYTRIGTNGGADFIGTVRFTPTELASYAGRYLTSVSFIPGWAEDIALTTYSIVVWQGGSIVDTVYNPGTVIVNQPITAPLNPSALNTIILDTAQLIDVTQELWIGIRCVYDTTCHPLGASNNGGVVGKGALIVMDNEWDDLAQISNLADYNWNIIGHLQTADNILSGYNLYRNDVLLTSVGATSYLDSVPNGSYTYNLTAEYANGCESDPITLSVTMNDNPCMNCLDTATVGTGTESVYYLPVNTFYNYSYSQQIFTAAELGTINGSINCISFQYIHNTAQDKNIVVYMGNTDKVSFNGGNDWIPTNQMFQVFSGTVNFTNAGPDGWVNIPFDVPFEYDGTSNIVVAVLNNTGSYVTSSDPTFSTHSASSKSLYLQNDSSPYSVNNPGSGTVGSERNNMRFLIGDPVVCPMPTYLTVSSITSNSATISWHSNENHNGYELVLVPAGSTLDNETVETLSDTFFTATALLANTNYTVYLRANCGVDNSFWNMGSFKTLCEPTSQLPYVMDMDGFGTGSGVIPDCSEIGLGGTYSSYPYLSSSYHHSGNAALYFYSYTPNSTMIRFQGLDLTNNTEPLLMTFWEYKTSAGYGRIVAGYMTDSQDFSTFVPVKSVYSSDLNTSTWTEFTFALPASVNGQVIYPTLYCPFAPGSSSNYVYIDDISIYAGQADCMAPNNLTISNVGGTSALVSWEADLTATGTETYHVEYAEQGSDNWQSVTATGTFALLSGLSPQTFYNVMLYMDCDAGVYSDTLTTSFVTNCLSGGELPIGNGTANNSYLPSYSFYNYCYTQQIYLASEFNGPSTLTSIAFNATTINSTRAYKIYLMHTTATDADNWLPTDSAVLVYSGNQTMSTGWNTYNFSMPFDYNGTDNLAVIVIDETGSYTTSNQWMSHTTSSTLAKYIYQDSDPYSISSTPSGGSSSSTTSRANVIFGGNCDSVATCVAPNVVVTDYTDEEITLTWAPGDQENSWELEYKTADTTDWTNAGTVNTTTYTFTGLTPYTQYDFRVRSLCSGSEFSNWVSVSAFTVCAYVDVPYTEDFESGTGTGSGSMADCWFGGTNYTTQYPYISTTQHVSGTKSLYFYGTSTYYSYAATPKFDDSVVMDSLLVNFKLYSTSSGYSIEAGIMSDPTNYNTFVPLGSFTPTYSSVWEDFELNTSAYAGSGHYLAFRIPAWGTSYMYLDDLSVTYKTPCAHPNDLAAQNVTSDEATITWTPGEEESEWEYVYGLAGTVDVETATPTSVYTNSVTLSGLTDNTLYDFYVRSVCPGEGESGWINFTFATECLPMTTLPYTQNFDSMSTQTSNVTSGLSNLSECWEGITTGSTYTSYPYVYYGSSYANSGNYSLRFYSYYSGNYGDQYAILPAIDPDVLSWQSLLLEFAMKNGTTTSPFTLIVGVMEGNNINTFVPVDTIVQSSTSYTVQSVAFGNYQGNGKRIAIVNKQPTNSYSYGQIDDIMITAPTCIHPNHLMATDADTSSITLSWNERGSATSWNIEYGPTGFTQGTGTTIQVTTNPYTVTGLPNSSTFDFYVQSECSASETSIWSIKTTANTTMVPTALPYATDFSDPNDAWILNNGSCTNYWVRGTTNGGPALFVTQDGTSAGYDITSNSMVSAEKLFTVGTDADITIQFDVTVGGESSYDYLKLFVAPATMEFPASSSSISSSDYGYNSFSTNAYDFYTNGYGSQSSYHYVMNLTGGNTVHVTAVMPNPNTNPNANSTAKVVFAWRNDPSAGTQPGAIITNVQIGDITCPNPTGLTVSNITMTSADVSWTAGGDETAWVFEYKESSATSWTTVPLTTTSYQLTNLTAATLYDVRVQADCGNGDESIFTTTSFGTTLCSLSDQCTYTFNLTDDYGDGWNGGSLDILQNGILVTNIGMSTGASATETVNLCDNMTTSLVWHPGTYDDEAGFTVIGPDGTQIYTVSDMDYYTTYTFTTDCSGAPGPVITDPTVATTAATSIAQTTATLNGTITNPDNVTITAKGFEWKTTTGGTYQAVNATGSGLTYNLTGLTANTGYTYKAFITFNGTTIYGNEVTFNTLPEDVDPCNVPTGLTVGTVTHESIAISWDNDANVNSWNIQYRPVGGTLASATSATNSYTITGLAPETEYQIQVQADCGDGNVSDWSAAVTATTTTGIENWLMNSISLYPNPAKEYIDVRVDELHVTSMEVYDVYGKLISTVSVVNNPTRINVSGLASGMYFVRVTTEQGVVTKSFVKK